MDEHSADDDLRALRDADPAAGVEASQSLRDRIAGIPGEAPAATPVPLRPRRRWFLPVAAAGAVVAAIGGGYIWGAGGPSLRPDPIPLAVETGTPDRLAAPIGALDDFDGSADPGQSLPGSGGDLGPSTDTAASLVGGYPWGLPANRQRFIVPVFDAAPAQAEVYAIDGRARYSAEEAARMAAELGVEGDVREFVEGGGGWIVGDTAGAHFILTHWSGATATFNGGTVAPWTACELAVSPQYPALESAAPEVVDAFQAALNQCLAATPMPTDEQAREALRSFLAATGVTVQPDEITLEPNTEQRVISASAAWVVGNNATAIVTGVQVSAAGLLSGTGPTGEIVTLGAYPIVGAAEAAARLNDPAFSPSRVSLPESDGENPLHTQPTAPPEAPDVGSPVPWAITEREIVSARLGLALLHGADGQQFLAPAYEFTAADDTVWSVIALAEDGLDTTASDDVVFLG
jgi:hypothetical protein